MPSIALSPNKSRHGKLLCEEEPAPGQRPATPLSREELPEDVVRALGLGSGRRRRRWIALGILLLALAAVGFKALGPAPGEGEAEQQWLSEAAQRGEITVTVRATGSLQPVETVAVGAEVSGRLETVEVEANDQVTRGQVLARLETATLENALAQAEASLVVSQASVARAKASLNLERAELNRIRSLEGTGVITETEQATALAKEEQARADLASAEAQLKLAEAKVDLSRTTLSKAVILSPIDGVVLERNVQPGNTIAASFQTPELFTLAAKLEKMELSVSVDEADVGRVQAGQSATFTVDAWPKERFEAKVTRVHLAATVSDNVVTYATVLSVDNLEGKLRPGMTGSATLVTGRHEGVLLVPNTALRFSPPQRSGGGGFRLGPPRRAEAQRASGGSIWVLREGAPKRVAIQTGATNGEQTEVLSGLAEGDLVLTGVQQGAGAK